MRRRTASLAAFLLLAALCFTDRARACELTLIPEQTIDPAQVGVDQTPPQLAQPTVAELQKNDNGGGCQPKCGPDHTALLTNLATDDMTPVDKIGYRVALVSGAAPNLSNGRTNDIAVLALPHLLVLWDGDDDFD